MRETDSARNSQLATRNSLVAGLVVLIYVSSFHLVGTGPAQGGLDPSWHAVLEYAVAREVRFGGELVYTYGPLGFLYGESGTGELLGWRVAFGLLWSGVVVWAVLGLTGRMSGLGKALFPLLFVVLADFTSATLLVMVYAGWRLVEGPRRWWIEVLLCGLLAGLGLLMFTHLMLVVATVLAVAMVRGLRDWDGAGPGGAVGRWVTAWPAGRVVILGSFCFVVMWMAVGQRLGDLPRWLAGGFDLVMGYSEAMSLPPNPWVLAAAVAAGALLIVLVGMAVWRARWDVGACGLGMLLLIHGFVAWKHGFVRADDHVYRFLYFVPLLGCLAVGLKLAGARRGTGATRLAAGEGGTWSLLAGVLLIVLVGLCLLGGARQGGTGRPGLARQVADRLRQNAAALRLVAAVVGQRELSMLRQSPQDQVGEALTVIAEIVGDDPIDVMNYQQGLGLAAGLNYQPRPVFQSFAAYTGRLQQRNVDFYRRTGRPPYVLYHLATIDQRFPALDDAPLLPLILHNYRPVAADGMFLLLRRFDMPWEEVEYELLHEQTVGLDEAVDLSPWNDRPIFAQIEMRQTVGGSLLKFAFQPVPVMIQTRTMWGEWLEHRYVPSMGRRGFLLSPRLLGNDDVISLWGGGGARVEQVRFGLPDWQLGSFRTPRVWGEARLRLYRSPNFLAHHRDPAAQEALRSLRSPVFNIPPLEYSSAVRVESVVEEGRAALMVHAPGRVLLEAPPGAAGVSGYFGIRQRAYTEPAGTNGVIFIVELEGVDGTRRRVFERHLRPMDQVEDRGMQRFEAELAEGDRRVLLITDPAGDLRYDWSYWADVRVEHRSE